MPSPIYIGCAGWSLSKSAQAMFAPAGSHLQRYATQFSAVEINSSFYRPHRQQTYQRWANSVGANFRFSVKLPKAITHTQKLQDTEPLLAAFFDQVSGLEAKLGCILIQLPPSLAYASALAGKFFDELRNVYQGQVVLEARHASWFEHDVTQQLVSAGVARVIADPAVIPGMVLPDSSFDTAYFRLHGSPRIYYSAYDEAYLNQLATHIAQARRFAQNVWCIFDNTAAGAAISNALSLKARCD